MDGGISMTMLDDCELSVRQSDKIYYRYIILAMVVIVIKHHRI